MNKLSIALLALLSFSAILAGCGSADTTATKEQEQAFRNPPKNPPPGFGPKGPPQGQPQVPGK